MRFAWLAFSLLLAMSAAAADPGAARQQSLIDLLIQDCGSCHGLTLRGGLGPALEPARLEGHTVDSLARIILDGQGAAMPPWRGMLSVDEARWIAQRLLEGVQP